MTQDKYSAVWVSHTSISDFLACPRSYYLKHIYKNPQTGHKMRIISPPLSLGSAVHEVVESLSVLSTEKRLKESLVIKFDEIWKKFEGKKGGFIHKDIETKYKRRGEKILENIMKNPGPLKNLALKINMNLPYYWLSEKDNIILCGKIDWLEYLSKTNSIHIIDFKTSTYQEDKKSLQLSIYYLLALNCQKRKVVKASYWYLEKDKKPKEVKLPDSKKAEEKVLDIAKKMKLARQLGIFKCPYNGCPACKPMEQVISGNAEYVGVNSYNDDVYILDNTLENNDRKESIIL